MLPNLTWLTTEFYMFASSFIQYFTIQILLLERIQNILHARIRFLLVFTLIFRNFLTIILLNKLFQVIWNEHIITSVDPEDLDG